ncbi:MAG: hypothetical protein ACAI25_13995 [Planctomycetota bacterium]
MSDTPEEKPAEKPPEPAAAAPPPAPEPAPAAPAGPVTEADDEPAKGEDEAAKAEPPTPSLLETLDAPLTLATLLLGIVLLAFVQLSTKQLVDNDSLYHVGAANELAVNGDNILTKGKFPWMQGTFLRDHYADKELLFHALLMPFCSSIRTMDANAKYVTIVLGGLVLVAFVSVIRAAGIKHGWLWLLLLMGAGENFTYRLIQTRPHLLSIAIVLFGLRFILQRRSLPLYFFGFLLAWSYSGPQVLPAVALVAMLARWARGGGLVWKPFATSVVGVAAGLVLTPFGWRSNLYLWRVQNVDVLLRAWGVTPTMGKLGAELYPYTTRELVLGTPGFCITLVLCVGALLLARRRPSIRTATLGGVALASVAALFTSAKFLDYAAPLSVLFAASAVDDQWRGGGRTLWRTALANVFALGVIALALFTTARTHALVKKFFSKDPPLRGVATWLAGNAQGVTVVHFEWNEFSTLFHDNRKSFYLYGLDPTFMEVWRPELLEYLDAIKKSTKPLSGRWFAEYQHFDAKARFIVVQQGTAAANACYTSDLVVVHEDEGGAVFALTRE